MNTQTQTGSNAGRGNRRTHFRIALVTALAVAVFFAFSNDRPRVADASKATMSQQGVVQARATGSDAVHPPAWNGMPAPSSRATEGNVVDLTY